MMMMMMMISLLLTYFPCFSAFICYNKHFLKINKLHPRKMCYFITPLLKTFTLDLICLYDFSISFSPLSEAKC